MIAISTTELRKNLRKYLNMANKERVIIQCGGTETYEIVPAKKISDTDRYFSDPKVIKAIEQGKADAEAGRVTRIADPDDLWPSI
ncbi:type II toxin-antitoxin system Phd/YefM family antitoxin [Chlorobium sp. BLA1]|uniref:type II toxin-antitoxin system Phd/YefM family antitoxin n=1 Tax=Candidatus Chlorobium masyuteum TaxID=2716876 RepID=UPI00141E6B53|nr:type II toxin-antitoxin system Phd/YefM family antitoxin [Candidatus Chlorobium masyuteum]NHQ60274.1 type II toxin-antitoxin system Phd/YefM family antitoxin [Candidatus Chlorobium masyuteum]NTU44468.1 type II toxin-antitoxin system Phd/YefM family antitoxin [Chlorobiaceae bacterium]